MSERIPNNEYKTQEYKESKPFSPEVDIYLFRHAEASGDGIADGLTENGIEQAKLASSKFLESVHSDGGGSIKFLTSPTRRAEQTAEVMKSTMAEIINRQKLEDINLLVSHKRNELRTAGIVGNLRQQGIIDPIQHWLEKPDLFPDKTPEQVARRLKDVLDSIRQLADRLSTNKKFITFV